MDDWIDITMVGDTSRRMIRAGITPGVPAIPRGGPWSYGTIVRPKWGSPGSMFMDPRRLMVLADDGVQFSATVLVTATTWPVGYTSRGFSSRRWEPDD